MYADPGFLLLATDVNGDRLGCVGLRALRDDGPSSTAEVRRLFVRDLAKGAGIGRRLTEQLLIYAQEFGFSRLVLNTLPQMEAAVALYTTLGFELCEPYVDEPLEGVLYYALDLSLGRADETPLGVKRYSP